MRLRRRLTAIITAPKTTSIEPVSMITAVVPIVRGYSVMPSDRSSRMTPQAMTQPAPFMRNESMSLPRPMIVKLLNIIHIPSITGSATRVTLG